MGSTFFPGDQDLIPVFEDVNEPTHKLEGHLLQLKMASFFNQVQAVLFGYITPAEREEYKEVPSYEDIISYAFEEYQIPVITGLSYGHIPQKIPLPVGAPISLYLGSDSQLIIQDIFNRS